MQIIRTKYYIVKLITLLSLFLYLFPFQFRFFPLSNVRILQILGLIGLFIYIIRKGKMFVKILYFNRFGIYLFFIGIVFTCIINHSYQINFALTKGLYIILYSCSAFFIVYLMKKAYNPFTPIKALEAVVWVTLFQAIISLLFFCYPYILEFYNNLVYIDDSNIEKNEMLNSFRLVGVGSVQFANAAVHYGLSLWILIVLYLSKDSILYNKSWVLCIVGPLFCICGILSARTFFVMLLFTIFFVYYLLGNSKKLQVLGIVIKLFFPLFIIGIIIMTYLKAIGSDFIVEWVLELFVNINDGGEIETASTNELKEMYIWPSSIKTWLCGDGMSQNEYGGFYMDSDVGYIRSLYYWGIIGSFFYYYFQIKYASILKKSYYDIRIIRFINMILIWFFLYSLKEFWTVEPYWVLLLFIALFSNQSKKAECNGNYSILSSSISSDPA